MDMTPTAAHATQGRDERWFSLGGACGDNARELCSGGAPVVAFPLPSSDARNRLGFPQVRVMDNEKDGTFIR